MPLKIVRNNIVNMEADAIVNSANHLPIIGSGVDMSIYKAAGIKELLTERSRIGVIPFGAVEVTPAFNLNAKYIFHTVTPIWRGGNLNEVELLRSCYVNIMGCAIKYNCESVAIPLLATGNNAYPKGLSLRLATEVITSYLDGHDIMVYLVVNNEMSNDNQAAVEVFGNDEIGWDEVGNAIKDARKNGQEVYINIKTEEENPKMIELEEMLQQRRPDEPGFDNEVILTTVKEAMQAGGLFTVPVELMPMPELEEDVQPGEIYTVAEDIRFYMRTLDHEEGKKYYVAFTSLEAAQKGPESCTATVKVSRVLERTLFNDDVLGLVINPFTNPYLISKDNIIELFVDWTTEDTCGQICFYEKHLHKTEADAAFEPINGSYEIEAPEVIGIDNPVYSTRRGDYKRLYECYWNILNQAEKNGYHEIVVPNIGLVGGYPEKKACSVAIKAISDWYTAHPFPEMRVMLICGTKKRSKEYNEEWDKYDYKKHKSISTDIDEEKLYAGLQYAMELYKDKDFPENGEACILNALAQMELVRGLGFGTDMLLAALLHTALENKMTDVDKLLEKFGLDMVSIANGLYKDIDKPWLSHQYQYVMNIDATEDDRIKLLAMAKAIVELRSIYEGCKEDYEFWNRLCAPKAFQGFYYSMLLDKLKAFELNVKTERMYQEYVDLHKKLFMI